MAIHKFLLGPPINDQLKANIWGLIEAKAELCTQNALNRLYIKEIYKIYAL